MSRINLTEGRVKDFNCPSGKKQSFLWDSKVPGLGIRGTKGRKVFIHQGRLDTKTIRVKIGDIRTWTIEDARIEARRLQSIIDRGIDPRLDKIHKISEQENEHLEIKRESITLLDVWPIYIKDRTTERTNKKGWSKRHTLDHTRMAHPGGEPLKRGTGRTKPGALSPLMACKLIDLTPDRIKEWIKKEAPKRGTQARIAFDALRAFINWANDRKKYRGLASEDACSRRTKKEYLPAKKAKTDCLEKQQLPAWFAAVQSLQNPVISAYLQGLLLTGTRREELAGLSWEDIDFKWQSIQIRDKVEGLRTIPLTPYMSFLITSLPRRNQWVFSSPIAASGRIQEPRIAHNKATALAEIKNLTLHGLRRSFGTLSEWKEVPIGIVAQIMGHKPSATAEKHYRVRPLDLLRKWHVKIENFLLEEAGIEQPTYEQSGSNLKVVGKK